MYYVENDGFPYLITSGDERNEWWGNLVARIKTEVEKRVGDCKQVINEDYVEFCYSNSVDGVIRITRWFDEGVDMDGHNYQYTDCELKSGFFFSQMASYVNYEDHNGILPYVLAVLDGYAQEVVCVAKDGTWLGTGVGIDGKLEQFSLFNSKRKVKHFSMRSLDRWSRLERRYASG